MARREIFLTLCPNSGCLLPMPTYQKRWHKCSPPLSATNHIGISALTPPYTTTIRSDCRRRTGTSRYVPQQAQSAQRGRAHGSGKRDSQSAGPLTALGAQPGVAEVRPGVGRPEAPAYVPSSMSSITTHHDCTCRREQPCRRSAVERSRSLGFLPAQSSQQKIL